MLSYCQLDPKKTHLSEILFKIQKFSFKEMHLKMASAKVAAILPGLNLLNVIIGLGNSLSPVWHQADIVWVSYDL